MKQVLLVLFALNCAAQEGPQHLNRADGAVSQYAQESVGKILINQAGYYTAGPKLAAVTGKTSTNEFFVLSALSYDTVFTGTLGEEKSSSLSSMHVRIANFTTVKTAGEYVISIPGLGHSYAFPINDNVYDEVSKSVLKGFYYQRSDEPLETPYAGKWSRTAGHPDTVVLIHPSAASASRAAGTAISSPKGWYDAGDYNKYIVNSGITMGTLLSAYEDFAEYYRGLKVNIPESNDDVPDILNESLYNLRWMLTMQDPVDGGVYHKCTNAAFDGMVNPGVTKAPRYVVQKSTAAALNFAAVTAQASRIFAKYEKSFQGLSDSCETAAIKAWQWAVKNPEVIYDQEKLNQTFQPAVTTGPYGDRYLDDERLWAATELYISFRKPEYYTALNSGIRRKIELPSWSNVSMLACYSLLRFNGDLEGKLKLSANEVRMKLIRLSDEYLHKAEENAFQTVMGQSVSDFIWGSNSVAANQGILLLNVYKITGDKKYLNGALSNLDYLLGRNATGYSFVTGIGSRSPLFPHHRPSVADGIPEPVPGLLVGGPNARMNDKCNYPHTEPARAYVDATCSYASNEIAINWNAPMVYLANALCALRAEINKDKAAE